MSTSPTPVVFDLDGTLVDSEPNYFEAGRRLLARFGVEYTWQHHARYIGIGTRETLATLREEYGLRPAVEELLAEKNRLYLELARAGTTVFPEMRAFVDLLREGGHPMAVASGSSRTAIDVILAGTGLDEAIPTRVSAEEVARGKPEPDVFLAAARLLGVEPSRCAVLEDAVPGAEAAHRAGMACLVVPSVPESVSDPAFARAALLFRGGHAEFSAQVAYDWVQSLLPHGG